MTGDCHVRIRERLRGKFPRSTRLQELHNAGFTDLTIVAKNEFFGGKCVFYGCIPSEFIAKDKKIDTVALKNIQKKLSAALAYEINRLNCKIIFGEMSHIENKSIILKNEEHVFFDQVVLATGNESSLDFAFAENLEYFWQLEKMQRIIFYTDSNPAVLGIADLAAAQGHDVTVLITKSLLIKNAPSFQYFLANVRSHGVKVYEEPTVTYSTKNSIHLVDKLGKKIEIDFDVLLNCQNGRIKIPRIDGKIFDYGSIDQTSFSIIDRSDISLLGDALGLMSASEAAQSAYLLVKHWLDKNPINHSYFELVPIRFHAQTPLAMVGKPLTYLENKWQCLDFNLLGWTAIHHEEGRLWYLFNSLTRKIEAIHIFHSRADELIATARLLLSFPIDSVEWKNSFTHPSSSEIFAELAKQICRAESIFLQNKNPDVFRKKNTQSETIFIPELSQVPKRQNSFYLQKFSNEEFSLGLLDKDPKKYFATLLGLREIFLQTTEKVNIDHIHFCNKRIENSDFKIPFEVEEICDGYRITARGRSLNICYGEKTNAL